MARKLISLQSSYNRLKKQIDSGERTIANAQGELAEAKKAKDSKRIEKAQKAIEKTLTEIDAAQTTLTDATKMTR